MGWVTKVERCRCTSCGWHATRLRPKLCPSCRSQSVVSDGRAVSWRAVYRDPSGRQRTRTFARRSDADAYLAKQETTISERVWRDPGFGKVTLGDYLRQRVETSPALGESTRNLYRIEADRYIYPADIASTPLRALTPSGYQAFINDLSTKAGARTVEIVHRIISGTLTAAVDEDLIPSNPASRRKLPKVRKRPIRVLRPEEVETIADGIDPRYRALVLTAAYAGLRFGEAAGLRKRDLRLLERKLIIDGSVIQVGSKVARTEWTKTDHSLREVSIPAFLCEELARHLVAFPVESQDGLVFTAPKGGPLSRTVFRNRVWVRTLKDLGFGEWNTRDGRRVFTPAVRFHDLRHCGVAMAVASGAHPLAISRRMGHADIKVTMNTYGHLYAEADVKLADDLDLLRAAALTNAAVSNVTGFRRSAGARGR
jgi:integrase